MQNQQSVQPRSSGAKAIALDERATIARYRLQLLALILTAGFALGLHIVFGH